MCGHENRFVASSVPPIDGEGWVARHEARCESCGEQFQFDEVDAADRQSKNWEAPLAAAILAAIGLGFVLVLWFMGAE